MTFPVVVRRVVRANRPQSVIPCSGGGGGQPRSLPGPTWPSRPTRNGRAESATSVRLRPMYAVASIAN